jgi:hypothetical protein
MPNVIVRLGQVLDVEHDRAQWYGVAIEVLPSQRDLRELLTSLPTARPS